MDRTGQPTLIVNPASDIAFADLASQAVAALERLAPSELQRSLRVHHPNAVVRARDLANESLLVWYVYRDGHWVGDDKSHASVGAE